MPEIGSLHQCLSLPEIHDNRFPVLALTTVLPFLPWGDVGRVLAALAVYYAPTAVRRWTRFQYTPIYYAAYPFQGISIDFSYYFQDLDWWGQLTPEERRQVNRTLVHRSVISAFFDTIVVPLVAGAIMAWFLSPQLFRWTLVGFFSLKLIEILKSVLDFHAIHEAGGPKVWLLVGIYATYVMVSFEILRLAFAWSNSFAQRGDFAAFLSAASSLVFGRMIAGGLMLAVVTTIFSEYILGPRFAAPEVTVQHPPLDFRKHLRRSREWVQDLLNAGYGRPDIIALLLVETYFRPTWKRFLEYAVLPILRLVANDRAEHLSVGLAQLQLRHWHRVAKNLTLRDFENPITNYEACRAHLDWLGVGPDADPIEVTSQYVGAEGGFYGLLFEEARTWVLEVAGEVDNDPPSGSG